MRFVQTVPITKKKNKKHVCRDSGKRGRGERSKGQVDLFVSAGKSWTKARLIRFIQRDEGVRHDETLQTLAGVLLAMLAVMTAHGIRCIDDRRVSPKVRDVWDWLVGSHALDAVPLRKMGPLLKFTGGIRRLPVGEVQIASPRRTSERPIRAHALAAESSRRSKASKISRRQTQNRARRPATANRYTGMIPPRLERPS